MAGYKYSSMVLFILWISSKNKTSPSAKFVKIAAKSPALSKAGPEVALIVLPISLAIKSAKVVLPNPELP